MNDAILWQKKGQKNHVSNIFWCSQLEASVCAGQPALGQDTTWPAGKLSSPGSFSFFLSLSLSLSLSLTHTLSIYIFIHLSLYISNYLSIYLSLAQAQSTKAVDWEPMSLCAETQYPANVIFSCELWMF